MHAVTLAETAPLVRDRAIVVQGGPPQHAAVGHHALAILQDFTGMAINRAATDVRDPQISGVDEPDEFRAFMVQQRVRPYRVRRSLPCTGKAWQNVSLFLDSRVWITAVAIHATEVDSRLVVRVVGAGMARDAARTLPRCLCLSLAEQIDALEFGRQGERLIGSAGCLCTGRRPRATGGQGQAHQDYGHQHHEGTDPHGPSVCRSCHGRLDLRLREPMPERWAANYTESARTVKSLRRFCRFP